MRIEVIMTLVLCSVFGFIFLVLPYLNPMTYQCWLYHMNFKQLSQEFVKEWC